MRLLTSATKSVPLPSPPSVGGSMTFINTIPQDGYITTEELLAFFGETGTKRDAARNASDWLKEIDGYSKNDGYITLVG